LRGYEELPYPVLSFSEPYAQEMFLFAVGDAEATLPYAFGGVSNTQSAKGRGETARSAIPRLTYRSAGTDASILLGPINGRWRELPSAAHRIPTQLHTGSITIDLDPNQIVHEFDLAIGGSDGISSVDADQATQGLGVSEAIVDVEIVGNNFSPVACSFCVRRANGKLAVKKMEPEL
jgi:hypothetical protein